MPIRVIGHNQSWVYPDFTSDYKIKKFAVRALDQPQIVAVAAPPPPLNPLNIGEVQNGQRADEDQELYDWIWSDALIEQWMDLAAVLPPGHGAREE